MARNPQPYKCSRDPLPLVAMGLALEVLFLLAVLGPFSLLDHGTRLVDLGFLTHYQPEAARLITAGLLALFLFYGFALTFAARSSLAIAILGTACFAVTLSFLYPVTANDIYTYAVQGYIADVYGLNPLVDPPARAAGDAFVQYAGQWINSASPYGPLWVDVSRLAARVSGRNIVAAVLVLKLFNAALVVGSSVLLARLVPRRPAFAAVFFGWNPLVQLELVGNGHNDALMIFLLLAAIALARARHRALGGVLLTGSILTKYLTIGVLPFYLLANLTGPLRVLPPGNNGWRACLHPRRLIRTAPIGLAALLSAVFLFAPYWVGPPTLQRLLAVETNYLASPSALVILLVPGLQRYLAVARHVLLAAVYVWLGLRLLQGKIGEERAIFEGLFVLILCAPHFAGWYLAALVALAPLVGDTWTAARAASFSLVATLTVPLWAFVWPTHALTTSLVTFHEIIVPLTFGPPLLVAAIGTVVKRKQAKRGDVGNVWTEKDAKIREKREA